MRKNQTSMTAIGIAILRGIESEKPAGERLCYDPYARRFVNPALYNWSVSSTRSATANARAPA